ncbi:syntaxin-19 [Rhinatrema bivittatum]|uniref:syntaxin-19 n=1 Tax=Rhinatrema bivittatum TaxID=194408 RepID=UPI0011279811|nr:syntaxin-19 [Rhinatrema bivittatum]XP_029434847.1 syntaxin-19 [Rhinatrema bivittatum]
MRDRLQELKQRAKELEASGENNAAFTEDAGEHMDFKQQAIVYEKEPMVENYLHEVQKLHDDITDFSDNVQKFGQQQKTLVSSMRRFSVIKKESNITRDIKIQAEHISKRLDALAKLAKRVEAENGPSASLTRILKGQHAGLFRHFQNTMCLYNETIATKQQTCKTFIIRQLEVAGKEVSEPEVNKMFEQGKWEVFNENLLTEAKITKAQLSEIEQRHKELINLENQIKELRDLFIHISLLVEEQGDVLNNIEMATSNTEDYVQSSTEKFKLAAKYRKRNPCRMLCCCCCPCCS